MNETQAYEAIDVLRNEIAQKKAAIAAILDALNLSFAIRCEWTKDHTVTYFSPRYDYPGYSRRMSHDVSVAKVFQSRRDAQWYLDECFVDEQYRAEKLGQIWSVVSIPHQPGGVK